MMDLDVFKSLPKIADIARRCDFETRAVARLDRWQSLDAATSWCETRWAKFRRPFRRRIDPKARVAWFEFASEIDALAFHIALKRALRPHYRAAAQ
jgi:hypothetical protein